MPARPPSPLTRPHRPEASPPSILITSNFSNRVGFAWTAFYRVFNRIARDAHERGLGVVLSFAKVRGSVDVIDADIPREVIEFDPRLRTLGEGRRLGRDIRRHNIRYAYLTDYPPRRWLYALMRLYGVDRIVPHSHVSVSSPHPAEPDRGLRRVAKTILGRSPYITADHVLTCSQFVKDRLVRKARFPEERITVLNYGLPEARFHDPTSAPKGASDRPVRVFCAARASRVKGIQHLIEATRLLTERGTLPEFEVCYAGSGPDLEDFERRASGLGATFRFLGFVDDTTSHLREADIVVIPSVWGDAFPYSVLEALAAGKPVVASRAGGIPEQVGDSGCGILVPPGDDVALADALERLIRDPEVRDEMGREAYRRARERFREEDYLERVTSELFARLGIEGVGDPPVG